MPIHDWTRVSAGTFHAFHNSWITHLQETLNDGGLPDVPLFLTADHYINVPLENTYLAAWHGLPERWRRVLDPEISQRRGG